MLDRRDDAPAALHACNHAPSHDAGEQRVFGEIFEIAPATRITNEICCAAKKHVEALRSRLRPDRLALKPRHIGAPGRGEGEIGRHRSRRVAVTDVSGVGDAKLRIRLLQRRNAEARHAGHVTCRANRSGRSGLAAPSRRDHAMDQGQLLLLCHLVERQLRATGGGQRGIRPRPFLRCRGSAEGKACNEDHRGNARRTCSLDGQISPLASAGGNAVEARIHTGEPPAPPRRVVKREGERMSGGMRRNDHRRRRLIVAAIVSIHTIAM